MFQIEDLSLKDARLLTLPAFSDDRGWFVKTFQDTTLRNAGVDFTLRESYFSTSRKDVIRGMHFQIPPHQHSKIVFCPFGAILDVIIDLRKHSPTYGMFEEQELSAENRKAFYIPEGFAHGFKSLTEDAITYYLVSSEYSKESDSGILYSSFGFDWQTERPLISGRDRAFVPLKDFASPF